MAAKIKIIAIGKVKEKYIQEGINEFMKRLGAFCKVEIVELKDEGIEKEAEKIMKHIGNKTFVLDALGKEMSSEEFADFIKKEDSEITFVIGSAEGVSHKIKEKANKISLSRMTFTHEMCRLFLIEQIYRAFMILNNRPYHK